MRESSFRETTVTQAMNIYAILIFVVLILAVTVGYLATDRLLSRTEAAPPAAPAAGETG